MPCSTSKHFWPSHPSCEFLAPPFPFCLYAAPSLGGLSPTATLQQLKQEEGEDEEEDVAPSPPPSPYTLTGEPPMELFAAPFLRLCSEEEMDLLMEEMERRGLTITDISSSSSSSRLPTVSRSPD